MKNKHTLDFGDYCQIEQKRYGTPNEVYCYKVIGSGQANYYQPVPVMRDGLSERGPMCDVVKAIRCGVDETKVETFRRCDVSPAHRSEWQDERPTEGEWFLSIGPGVRHLLNHYGCQDAVRPVWVSRVLMGTVLFNGSEVDEQLLVGAKWKPRTTPNDPFAEGHS